MGKIVISKLFLYKHRFLIGYILLAIAFLGLIFAMPIFAPNGLSEAEMESAVVAQNITDGTLSSGDIVDLPYHVLQKLSIKAFGLNPYAIRLPSIVIGAVLGVILILLLNRWFKNNVAISASVLTVLSSSFLYITGTGTPLIMFVFWPTVLLWLGSKIQGIKKPRPFFSFLFAFALLGAVFTPYLIYLAVFILLLVLLTPHLRYTVKTLPKIPFLIVTLIITCGVTFIIMNAIKHPTTISRLLFTENFNGIGGFIGNIGLAMSPFFAWTGTVESTFLAPLISLPTLALGIIGLISTTKGFFASRNSIATYLIIFAVLISGFRPEYAILLILPVAILVAHGLRYIIDKWYSIFPENPYARLFGILPIGIFMGIMIFSDISHYFFGYRYNPAVAPQFSTDLSLLDEHLEGGDTLLLEQDSLEHKFYKIYADLDPWLMPGHTLKVVTEVPKSILGETRLLTLGAPEKFDLSGYELERIVTSPMSQNADRIYIYNML